MQMPPHEFHKILITAAESVLPERESRDFASYATWKFTRHDDEFEADSTADFLRREGRDVDESLLRLYAQPRSAVELSDISLLAPWIECLPDAFAEYSSFDQLRDPARYQAILTFTTSVISASCDAAFLEVWIEDGRYGHMGRWYWVLLHRVDERWQLAGEIMHSLS